MIDFRYHVVSIVAVFLALATGLVLGASLLNTPLIKGLDSANDALINEKEDLRDQVTELEGRSEALADSVAALSPFALANQLAGQQVVVVELPGADDAVATPVTEAVLEAGGSVTGIVDVLGQWTDATDTVVLDELVARLAQPGVTFTEGDDEYGRAATLLASALVTQPDASPGTPDDTEQTDAQTSVDPAGRETILQGLREGGFVDVDPTIPAADLAIVVAPPAPDDPDERAQVVNEAWADIAAALDAAGLASVLVGPGEAAGEDGLLASVRADDTAAANVSTVDSVDEPLGPAVTVLALSKQLAGFTGHYGLVDAADGPVPPFTPVVEN